MTIETTYSQAREGLKGLMDRAVQDREVVMVRRRKGGDVALGVCLTFPQAQPPRPRSPLGVPIAALSLGPERP